ncbi:UDP-glucuronate 4-epimerase 1-like [Ananas comosus]|uniref:UDP-glucuronate 4-epimerase n=1 Tax=Ananas comosus TaxID=4615 RepID=A0A6P5FCC1_ANACO|nr:UDP-glucuronate 4-epimerase 1-like [Ananas comosus]
MRCGGDVDVDGDGDVFPSTPGKLKTWSGGSSAISRHHVGVVHRCFASTSTLFLWALLLVALTASYLSFAGLVDTSSRYLLLSASRARGGGGGGWERRVGESARPGAHRGARGLSVLVTGAAGFVGSHAALALRRRGDGVVGVDNFNAYYDPSLKRARGALLASHGVFVAEGDVADPGLLARLFGAAPFTHVLHLAAQAGVRYAMENPSSYVHSNVAALVALLEACRGAEPRPALVWASSSSVYGLNEKVPFAESDPTDRPASLYAATKKAGEAITHAYSHIYGISVTGLRFFTVYGPWGRPDMAYFAFTRNILQGKPITVYRGRGGVDLARDFTYIDDVVRGCLAALDTARRGERGPAQYRIYNLGNTAPVTVPRLVYLLEKHLGVRARRRVVDMPGNGDVPFTHADVARARADLGYRPRTNLDAGLKKFVKWYLSYYGYSSSSSSSSSGGRVVGGGAAAATTTTMTTTENKQQQQQQQQKQNRGLR